MSRHPGKMTSHLHQLSQRASVEALQPCEGTRPDLLDPSGSLIRARPMATSSNSLRSAHRRGLRDPSRRAVALVVHGWGLSSSWLRIGHAGAPVLRAEEFQLRPGPSAERTPRLSARTAPRPPAW
jgi:hypothetical protein